MIERVIYTPEAEQDVADAYNWYEAREQGWARSSCAAWRLAC
jgi:plasmid stabilization system protein ParE